MVHVVYGGVLCAGDRRHVHTVGVQVDMSVGGWLGWWLGRMG